MFEEELTELRSQNLFRRLMRVDSYEGPRINVDGKSLLLLCSNDYLGLANHPALSEAACEAMKRYGFGAGAARLVSGSSAMHHELEAKLAQFKGTEAALVFNSGYAANTGILQAVVGSGDLVLSDSMNHASIVDGCRLSKTEVAVYRHKDATHVEEILKAKKNARRKLIVTDSVFSMDGDIAPLPELAFLAEKYGAMLMVDDAHATGVLGTSGKGSVEHFGLDGRVGIQMGTLGKAVGSFGAYVAGSKELIDYLINRSRSFIYSTALPPAVCAASIAGIEIIEEETDRREQLWKNRDRFVSGLTRLGIAIGQSETPIIPIIVGESSTALQIASKLFEYGIYAIAIRPPTVQEGTARIRATVMATHTNDDIETAISVFERLKQEGIFSA